MEQKYANLPGIKTIKEACIFERFNFYMLETKEIKNQACHSSFD